MDAISSYFAEQDFFQVHLAKSIRLIFSIVVSDNSANFMNKTKK